MASFHSDPGQSYLVTPSDAADLPISAEYLLIENPTAGTMCAFKITTANNKSETHYLPAGQYYWGPVKRVWAAGLTAGTIITAFY